MPKASRDAVTPCRWCGAAAPRRFVATDRNRRTDARRFHYHRCSRCRLVFLADPPEDLGRYYPELYHALPSIGELRQAARAREGYRLDLLRQHVSPPGRVVEVGPGSGVFAVQALDDGWEVTGLEMDARCCEHLRGELGVTAIQTESPQDVLRTLPASRAVVLWHALEHLERPLECLGAAADNLEPHGVLLIATPNPEALGLELLGHRWPHLDAPRHLQLVPAALLLSKGARAGLHPITLTSDDEGGRMWNAFGWAHAVTRPRTGRLEGALMGIGRLAAGALAGRERRHLRGAAYTALFSRRP